MSPSASLAKSGPYQGQRQLALATVAITVLFGWAYLTR